jgi:thiamine transport system substrate-binding protein
MKLTLAITALVLLSGCLSSSTSDNLEDLGWDGTEFPDLSGRTLTILSHESFGAFELASSAFKNLTGIDDVVLIEAGDTGSALRSAIDNAERPEADLIYGLDNAYLHVALKAEILEPYMPLLADRIMPSAQLFGDEWMATPTDQGYVGINWDPDGPGMENVTINDLFQLRTHADKFVTQSPKTSSPGLGFLLITIDKFGQNDAYDWQDYWTDLFEGGLLVTAGWGDAYEGHFSGGYGIWYGGAADKAIVNSYTESPAVEYYFGTDVTELSNVLVAPGTTWHQVQTTAILKGAKETAAAQAWIEFTLTDEYQELAFPNGVYPVVASVDANDYYGGVDPEPGTFTPVSLGYETIGDNVERWVSEWDSLCKKHGCA